MDKAIKDEAVLTHFLTIPAAWTAELAAQSFDILIIDMQHSVIDSTKSIEMIRAIQGIGKKAYVRLPWNEPSVIMKMLDAGADGLICPMIETAKDAETFIQACLFPPDGNRSYGPFRAAMRNEEDYLKRAAGSFARYIMLETASAAEALEEIATLDHLDGIFVGPWDLSVSLDIENLADLRDPQMHKLLNRLIQLCKIHTLTPGMMVGNREDALLAKKMGFKLISFITDGVLLQRIQTEIMDWKFGQ